MAKVVLENIFKSFGDRSVLKDINLTIEDGEFVVLVGASGCGKSTLLRLIAGLEHQTRGNIYIDDKLVNNVSPKDRDIAMVFQSYALYPHLTVKENIGLSLKIKHVPKCEIERRTNLAAEILKLDEYLNSKPKELSGGQRQRLTIARALSGSPKILILDDSASALDLETGLKLRDALRSIMKDITIIFVTQRQAFIKNADRIVVMQDGEVRAVGTHEELEQSCNIYQDILQSQIGA